MIDWLTMSIDASLLSAPARDALDSLAQSRILKIHKDGTLLFELNSFESLRSDFKGVAVRLGSQLTIAGSPARVVSDNNAFGSRDIFTCSSDMVAFVEKALGVSLPDFRLFHISRMDINEMFCVGAASDVTSYLSSQLMVQRRGKYPKREDSYLIWKSSARESIAIYDKYKHALYAQKKGDAVYTFPELELLKGLVRIELRFGRKVFFDLGLKTVLDVAENFSHFVERFESVVGEFIGEEVSEMNMDDMKLKFVLAAESLGYGAGVGKSALKTLSIIRGFGVDKAKTMLSQPTYSRHQRVMLAAGLTLADITSGTVIPFRRKVKIVSGALRSFDDVRLYKLSA